MKGVVIQDSLNTYKTDVLLIFTCEDEPSAEYKQVELLLPKELKELQKTKEFTGKPLQTVRVRTPGQPFKNLLLVSLGKKEEVTLETLRRAAGTAVKAVREFSSNLAIPFLDAADANLADAVQAVTEGLILGDYRFSMYKTQGLDELKQLAAFAILVEHPTQLSAAKAGLERGRILAEATKYARDLVNTPPSDLTPATLEKEARRLAKRYGLKLTVFNEATLKRRKMNAILAVGRGSSVKPRMLILEYKKGKPKRHLVFCGKGVTYDAGGYNLKTRMLENMKDDMGGAAALLGMLRVVAEQGLKVKLTVIIGAVENLINGEAYKPGDVVRAMNSKTIEVANTDAEGRIVLADCLSYASTLKGDVIVDIATLTGAAMSALGTLAAAVCTPNDDLAATLIDAGEATGDRAWRIPMWDDYKEDVKSDIADVKNLGYQFYAGITAGAVFLQEFVKEPEHWMHIDMGGAVNDDRERPYKPKGATGWGVRILTRFVETWL